MTPTLTGRRPEMPPTGRRRSRTRYSCAKRTPARPSRDDRAGNPGLPARGAARRALRHRAPLRDPRRDDPAPGRPAPRRAARRAGANHAHESRRPGRCEDRHGHCRIVRPLPPGHRDPHDGRDPRRGAAARRPDERQGSRHRGGAGRRPPHATTTSSTSERSPPRRSRSRSRSPRCARTRARGCAWNAASAWGRITSSTRSTRSTRGWRRSGASGSTRMGRAAKLPARSHVTTSRSRTRGSAATGRTGIERSNNAYGRAQAQGLPRSTGRPSRPPGAHAAPARGVPALPSAEAQSPGVPELRLLRRPAGPRDQGPEGRHSFDAVGT